MDFSAQKDGFATDFVADFLPSFSQQDLNVVA